MKVVINPAAKTGSVMDRVQTLEAACAELGITGEITIEIPDNAKRLFPFLEDNAKAAIVTEALNEGWVPNWDNKNEKKWQLYFNMQTGEFSLSLVIYSCECSDVPSRLCFKNEELARHAVKYFSDIYRSLFQSY